MPKYTTAERLKQIMSMRDLKQVDIIRMAKPYCDTYKVKLGRNDLSQYVSGKVNPGQGKLYILAKALNVNEAWLMGCDVPMDRTHTAENKPDNAELEENIIMYHRDGKTVKKKMTKEQMKMLSSMIDAIPDEDNPDL